MKPIANGVHTREDLWGLSDWDPTLLWYARGVAAMQKKPITDPTSWRYQAAVHDYTRSTDPLAVKGEAMPSPADQKKFWKQCQHGSWFFLPWHRGYLAQFEQIVRAEIVKLNGPADWALPYWNYSDDEQPNARLVRKEFREQNLPDGKPNALARGVDRGGDPQEAAHGAQTGDFGLSDGDVDLSCLTQPLYRSGGGAAGFGGPATGFHHPSGPSGALEAVPHGAVHSQVGGWLGAFDTAGLDPLFWCHHANIDRLWEVWIKRDNQHVNPSSGAFLTALTFPIHNAAGQPITFTVQDVLDTRAPSLAYQYEDTSDPLAGAGLAAAAGEADMAEDKPPDTVRAGASGPVALSSEATTASVALHPNVRAPEGAALADAGPAAGRVYLNIENIVGKDNTVSYEVYINAQNAAALSSDQYAGLLPMFGVAEASSESDTHGGSGLTRVLDITDLVKRMKSDGTWRDGDLKVTFVPKGNRRPKSPLHVGNISLYYS
jgi:tyrosinase